MIWIILMVISALTITIAWALTTPKKIWNPRHVWTREDFEEGRQDMVTQLLIDIVLLDLHRQVKVSFRRAVWLFLRKTFAKRD